MAEKLLVAANVKKLVKQSVGSGVIAALTSHVASVMTEASEQARKEGRGKVTEEHVELALVILAQAKLDKAE